jgi:hypothetical protein
VEDVLGKLVDKIILIETGLYEFIGVVKVPQLYITKFGRMRMFAKKYKRNKYFINLYGKGFSSDNSGDGPFYGWVLDRLEESTQNFFKFNNIDLGDCNIDVCEQYSEVVHRDINNFLDTHELLQREMSRRVRLRIEENRRFTGATPYHTAMQASSARAFRDGRDVVRARMLVNRDEFVNHMMYCRNPPKWHSQVVRLGRGLYRTNDFHTLHAKALGLLVGIEKPSDPNILTIVRNLRGKKNKTISIWGGAPKGRVFINSKTVNMGAGKGSKQKKDVSSGLTGEALKRAKEISHKLDNPDWNSNKVREDILNDASDASINKNKDINYFEKLNVKKDHIGGIKSFSFIEPLEDSEDEETKNSTEPSEPNSGYADDGIDGVDSESDDSENSNLTGGSDSSDSSSDDSSVTVKKYKCKISDIKISPFPKSRSLFKTTEVLGENSQYLWNNIVEYDNLGAPFCGYVSVHNSIKKKFDKEVLRVLVETVNNEPDKMPRNIDQGLCIGTPRYLLEYCRKLGFNFILIVTNYDDKICKAQIGKYGVLSSKMFDERFEWVILKYKSLDEKEGDTSISSGSIGHYVSMVLPKIAPTTKQLPRFPFIKKKHYLYSMDKKIVVIKQFVADSVEGKDLRPNYCGNEGIRNEDQYSTVEVQDVLTINWKAVQVGLFGVTTIMALSGAVPLMVIGNLAVINSMIMIMPPPSEFVIMSEFLTVSNGLFLDHYRHIQITPYNELRKASLLNDKSTNTDVMIPGLLDSTSRLLGLISDDIHVNKKSFEVKPNNDLVQFNMPNVYSVITETVKKNILGNQELANDLYGGFCFDPLKYPNHFVRISKSKKERAKVSVPIATAPVDCIYNNGVPVSPGMLPVTDYYGIFFAFAGRSMSKMPPVFTDEMAEFVDFFRQFYQPMIDSIDLSEIYEEDEIQFFRKNYQGKKSQMYIEGTINQYINYLREVEDPKYDQNSCFVKLENSAKLFGDDYAPKPRLIMTMSPVMLFQYCQFMKVVDVWNEGPIKEYQIKHEDMETMVRKVMEVQNRPHCVTDYSSFECSVIGAIRECEDWLILTLLQKAHLYKTARCYEERVVSGRYLKSNGVTVFINSRNSGDFHTSFGNGVINLAIGQFQSFKKTGKLCKMVVEGDDAVIEKGIMDEQETSKLGFKFSEDVYGNFPGDTDFLQKRWIDGKMYLNIGKMMSTFWVKNKANLKRDKQMFILRCMGSSLHFLSPGHPVLCSIVNRIGRLTRSYNKPFKNWFMHINLYEYKYIDVDNYPREVKPDDTMRAEIEKGAIGFPPIPIPLQIELEKMIESADHMDLQDVLRNYENINMYMLSDNTKNIYTRDTLEGSGLDLHEEVAEILNDTESFDLPVDDKKRRKLYERCVRMSDAFMRDDVRGFNKIWGENKKRKNVNRKNNN